MSYRITGLDGAAFAPLFDLSDAQLAERGARRLVAEAGLPCRVSLEDTAGGEELILVHHEHLARTDTPFRASGPIFVRRDAARASFTNELPPQMTSRLLSLRAYDADAMMVDADVIDGKDADALVRRLLARDDVVHVDAHFARRGCFGGRITRA